MIAQEIVDDLEAALEQFRLIAGDLGGGSAEDSAARGARDSAWAAQKHDETDGDCRSSEIEYAHIG